MAVSTPPSNRSTVRLLAIGLTVVVVALAATSGFLFLQLTSKHNVDVTSTQWHAIWASNGTFATIPGAEDYHGSCWDLDGAWVPSTMIKCELEFDSGAFGPTPASQHWQYAVNFSVASPFLLPSQPAVGIFGDPGGPFLTIFAFSIQVPSGPGDYAFSGSFTVS